MTEFARKPSKLQRLWARFRYKFLPRLRLFFATTKKAEELVAEAERRRTFWEDVVLEPITPEPEPRTVPAPDPAPVEPTGLVVRIDRRGFGHVYINGQELVRVKALHISVYPMEPVEVTLVMREPIDLQALTYHVEVSKEEPKEETTHA